MDVIQIIIQAGKSAVDISLYTLLPIMVVMLVLMKILEDLGILEKIIQFFSPLLKPFGLNGFGLFILIQLNFVSFVAPFATLILMEQRGISDRKLAATIAMIFAMGQANVFYPMIPLGLNWGVAIITSIAGGLIAALLTYYIFARKFSNDEKNLVQQISKQHPQRFSLVGIISSAGQDGMRISVGAIPMLVVTLSLMGCLRDIGAIHALESIMQPILSLFHIPSYFIMPALMKFFAGGNAYFGIATELLQQHIFNPVILNQSSGWLICMLDLPAIGLIMALGKRIAYVVPISLIGAFIGLLFRTFMHIFYFS